MEPIIKSHITELETIKKLIKPFSGEMRVYYCDENNQLHNITLKIDLDLMQIEIKKSGLGDLF